MHQLVILLQWVIAFTILFELAVIFKRINNQVFCHLYILCVSMLVSAYGYLMHLYASSEETLFATLLFVWAGRVFAIIACWRLSLSLCNRKVPKKLEGLDFLVGTIALFFLTTTKQTGIFFEVDGVLHEGDWNVLLIKRGIGYIIWDIIMLVAVIAMIIMYVRAVRTETDANKKILFRLLLTALFIELLIGLLTVLPAAKYYDFNQCGFFASSVIMVFSMLKYNLGDVEQSARNYVFDELSSGIIAIDANGKLAYFNQKALDILPNLNKDTENVMEYVREMIAQQKVIRIDERVYTPEKKEIERGSVLYILNDSTQHYHHLKELEEQKEIAENANRAKSDFLSSMSHEIRTPINAVLGMDEMILQESTESTVREYARDIQSAGRTLLSIINDILDISKIESGKMEIVPVDYDVSSVLYDLINMTRIKAESCNLLFETDIASDIPSKLFGDDLRIRQILMNLLSNATKYTKEGRIWLRVSRLKEFDTVDETVLHFEIEDTGIGIKPEDMDKLFSKFERIELEQNRSIEGTGLGIPITLSLLKLMDSELKVKSEYGKGTLFSFDLKQKVLDNEPIGDFESRLEYVVSERTTDQSDLFFAPDASILLVDDNEMNRKVIVSFLKKAKVKIREASEGESAVQLAGKEHFDLILMDHMMPGMDGVEAMKIIKKDKEGPCANTPIIVLTANAVLGSREKYLEAGFDGFLSKPIASDKLEAALREYLPKDKIKQTDSYEKCSDTSYEEEFPSIFGIDWDIAMMRMHDKSTVRSVLDSFFVTLDQQADKLQRFMEGLPDTLNDYRIMVHGMKSASGYIGILPLTGMAAVLEKASSEGDVETVNRLHQVFIREWKSYRERLAEYMGIGEIDDNEKEEISEDALKMLLNILSKSMEEMDIDGADKAMDKILSYRLPDEISGEMEALKIAVAELNQEESDRIISVINGIV